MHEHKKGDEHTRRQFMWLDQVLADQSLPAAAFRVAYVIAKHIHRVHGDAFLGTRRLSEKAGVSRVFAIKAMRLLETTGHLAVENGNGRGNTNRYQMVEKGAPGEQETVHGVDRFDEIKDTRQEGKGTRQEGKGTRQEGKGTQGGPDSFTNPLTNPLTNPFTNPLTPAAPASPASLSESDSNPSTASFFEKEESEAKEAREAKQGRTPPEFRAAPPEIATVVPPPDTATGGAVPKRRRTKDKPPAQDDAAFEAWWAEYPKKVGKPDAKRAFVAARKKASAEELSNGVRRYVEALNVKAAQDGLDRPDPQFIKNPSGWLNGERWLDALVPAPAAALPVIDQEGNPDMPYQANGGRMNGHPRPIGKTDEWMRRGRQHVLDGRRAREGGVS
jgi:hypothetical protein